MRTMCRRIVNQSIHRFLQHSHLITANHFWRIQINQAILAGIATITTNEAISDELVRATDCGLVVNAFRKKELLRAITAALDNPEQLRRWKENAVRFAPRISNEALASYFIEITDYILQGKESKERPVCPWQS